VLHITLFLLVWKTRNRCNSKPRCRSATSLMKIRAQVRLPDQTWKYAFRSVIARRPVRKNTGTSANQDQGCCTIFRQTATVGSGKHEFHHPAQVVIHELTRHARAFAAAV
jgi:hypothetical protein